MKDTLMSPAERFLSGFAQTWRDEQQRLWGDSSHDDHAARLTALEHAWRDACQQWWRNLRHVVPEALLKPLEAALAQSQLCIKLALRGDQISPADLLLMVPAIEPHASVSAQQLHHDTAHADLLASEAMMACLAQITQSALTVAREQLRNDDGRTPRELYAHCAHAMEDVYRQQAGSDKFAQLVGQWVNAHVNVLAARRAGQAHSADKDPDQRLDNPDVNTDVAADDVADQFLREPAPTPYSAPAANTQWSGDRIARQTRDFSDKLAAGASSLPTLPALNFAGVSASEVVFQCDGVKLLRYRRTPQKRLSDSQAALPPLLVVYSLVNRPYILDLDKERSFIRALCDGGSDVYLIDWGYPGERDTSLGLDDYINRYLHGCVCYLQGISETSKVDLIGICQGGPFALCYAALEPARVRRLALMVSPADFHTDDFLLARWMRYIDVNALVNTLGNVPGHLLNWGFIALKPVSLSGLKALELLDLLDSAQELATYIQMEHWLQDNPDQAGKAFVQFTQTFVRDNALVNATARIGARVVDLRAVHHRVLNLYAARDHIVPPSASRSLPQLLSNARCTNHEVDCGHIGVFTGRHAQSSVPKFISDWFRQSD